MMERSSFDSGRWTEYNERLFRVTDDSFKVMKEGKPIDQIQPLSRQPHTRTEWRNYSRGAKKNAKVKTKIALDRIDNAVAKLLQS